MPGGYTIDAARSLILSRAWDVLTGADLIRHARTLASDPGFKPDFNQLCDFRDVTEVRADAAAIRELAALNPFGSGARRALVVSTDVVFGMARMYQILTEPAPDVFEVFRDFDQALKWLGVTGAKAELLRALSATAPLTRTD
jgi:hypothetical protein